MSTLYLWGQCSVKQSFEEQNEFINKRQFEENILSVSCGDSFFFVRTNSKVYGCGDNSYGQLGIAKNTFEKVNLRQIQLPFKTPVLQIACGWSHTLILDQKGKVYSVGLGTQGALGYGTGQSSYKFTLVMKDAIMISAGKDHSLALTKTKVYGWGNSKDGQLGLVNKWIYYSPKELHVYPCSYIFAGFKNSFFVTVKGVYGTGLNHLSQLGLGHENNVSTPKRLNIDENIKYLIGYNYCVAVTQNKDGYIWGSGDFGKYIFPTKLQFLSNVERVGISSRFGLIKDCDQKIKVWGTNENNEIGLKDKSHQIYVTESCLLSKLQVDDLACGGSFSIGFSNKKIQNLNNWEIQSNYTNNSQEMIQNQNSLFQKYLGHKSPIEQLNNNEDYQSRPLEKSQKWKKNEQKYIHQLMNKNKILLDQNNKMKEIIQCRTIKVQQEEQNQQKQRLFSSSDFGFNNWENDDQFTRQLNYLKKILEKAHNS